MTERCQGALCGFPAEVVVERSEGPPLGVCWAHLQQWLEKQRPMVVAFHRIGWQAACCRERCSDDADAIVTDRDDMPHLFCRRHLDDLGWVQPPGVLLDGHRGWSGG